MNRVNPPSDTIASFHYRDLHASRHKLARRRQARGARSNNNDFSGLHGSDREEAACVGGANEAFFLQRDRLGVQGVRPPGGPWCSPL